MTIRFASYNIQYGKGQDGLYDLERIAREVESADVIAMQEVATGFARNDFVDQPAWFAERLDRHMVYGATYDVDASFRDESGRLVNRRRRFGNAVFSRFPIRSTRTLPLPFLPPAAEQDVQRCAVEAVIDLPGGPLRIYSIHLSHLTPGTRMPQIAALKAMVASAPRDGMAWANGRNDDWTEGWAEPVPPEPCILFGDFNLRPADPEYPMLVGDATHRPGRVAVRGQFVDSWVLAGNAEQSGYTMAQWKGQEGARIDYALLHPSLVPAFRAARIGTEAAGSDHLPIFLDLDLG
ncbi:hydrolase [Roseomonas frigidaquae]|uniref:Hydrolase n=1 Tax=Falsiroseomonas frigidaquae TaxID=487318 RepID=A0ABX1F7F8_9PROT|nr:hydrolase [Falsiroseomonas frigidaquae]